MKILYVGYTHSPIPFAMEYVRALTEIGYTVHTFDDRWESGITKGYAYPDLINDYTSGKIEAQIDKMYGNLMRLFAQTQYDLCLVENGKLFTRSPIDILKGMKNYCPVVMLCFDDCFDWLGRYVADRYSAIVTMDGAEKFRKLNLNTIEMNLCGVFSYHQKLKVSKIYDVSFIGSATAERIQLIHELEQAGIKVHTFGVGWNPDYVIKSQEELVATINASKICLNIQRPNVNYASLRFFETLGCGTPIFTDYCPDYLHYFPNGIIYWHTTDQLIKFIQQGLEYPEDLNQLGLHGRAFIRERFLLNDVMAQIMTRIKEVLHL